MSRYKKKTRLRIAIESLFARLEVSLFGPGWKNLCRDCGKVWVTPVAAIGTCPKCDSWRVSGNLIGHVAESVYIGE